MVAYWITVSVCGVYVGVRGDLSERLGVGAVAVASIVTAALVSPFGRRFHSMEWGIFGADTCLLLVLTLIVCRSTRYWPIWATGFQVVAIVCNTAVFSAVSPRAYALAQGFWAYAILASAVAGTWSRTSR